MAGIEVSMGTDHPAEWLLTSGFDTEQPFRFFPSRRAFVHCTALYEACMEGKLEVCRWLHENDKVKWTVRAPSSLGWTPLFVAALNNHLTVLQWLSKHGAGEDIRTKDAIGCSPMLGAVEKGHMRICEWLYESGAAADVRTPNDNGVTPLMRACELGHLRLAQWLHDHGAASDVCKKDCDGRSPMLRASYGGHLKVVEWLFQVGATQDVRTVDNFDETPLSRACQKGHMKVVEWLLLHGAAATAIGPSSCLESHAAASAHVDERLLRIGLRRLFSRPHQQAALRRSLADLQADLANFTRVVFPGVYSGDMLRQKSASPARLRRLVRSHKLFGLPSGPCRLVLLRGHESTLLAEISGFVGIPLGVGQRYLRETALLLEAVCRSEGT